ncbi:MAG: metallophosphoesterase [Cyclobacteriaceae bacterium]
MRLTLCLLLLGLCFSVNAQQPAKSSLEYSVFLIGDAGEYKKNRDKVLSVAAAQLRDAGEHSAVIFLGDNIYKKGLPSETHPERNYMEGKLTPQLDVIKNASGRGFIVPGNHDWDAAKEKGLEAVNRQEAFTKEYVGSVDAFYPKNGCPGPVKFILSDQVILALIDSQWPLHKFEKTTTGCENRTWEHSLNALKEIATANRDKTLIVAAHHPIYTYGSHAGILPLTAHIFPLAEISPVFYLLPLPILGSIYPIMRKANGNVQDVTGKKNKAVMNPLREVLENHPNAIHVAGHEHALEHIVSNNVNYIVSGSGSKTEFVKEKKLAKYAKAENGFSRINFYADGETWLEFWIFNKQNPEGLLDYEVKLK